MRSEHLSKKTIHCLCSLRSPLPDPLPVPFDDRIDGGFDALSPIMRAALEKSVRIRDKAPPACRHLRLTRNVYILKAKLEEHIVAVWFRPSRLCSLATKLRRCSFSVQQENPEISEKLDRRVVKIRRPFGYSDLRKYLPVHERRTMILHELLEGRRWATEQAGNCIRYGCCRTGGKIGQ